MLFRFKFIISSFFILINLFQTVSNQIASSKLAGIYLKLHVYMFANLTHKIINNFKFITKEFSCDKNNKDESCSRSEKISYTINIKYLFYDVNPAEGFNLRRDVYIRMATLVNMLNRLVDIF